ncbi:MAG: prepilin-type N-terminal cleavage/methylation domain-containing protein [Candidatus Wallbacteria bacterium]
MPYKSNITDLKYNYKYFLTKKNIKGFSFIEILTAIVMLGIVIIPLTRLLLFSAQGSRESEEYLLAYSLATDKIEQIKMLSFDKVDNEENDIFTKEEAEKIQDFHKFMKLYKTRYKLDYKYYDANYGKFGRTVTIDDKVDAVNTPPKLKKVTVNIYNKTSKKELATINTLISD